MNARRTLDLRQKLINMRANKSGLDLRYKIVANMIAKLRKQTKAFQNNPRFHPYVNHLNGGTTVNQSLRYSIYLHSLFCLGGVVCRSGMDRSTVSTIERLVGKLPPWIKNNNAIAQMIPRVNPLHKNYQQQVSRAGPVRIHPPALYQPVPMYQTNYITSRQSSCATSPNESFCDVPYANEVPGLDYEPIQNVMPPPLVFDPTPNQQRARSLSAGRYRKIIITVKYPKQIQTNLCYRCRHRIAN